MILPFLVLLLASLAALPACKKKKTESGGGGGTETTPSPAQVSSVSSDYLLFAHLKAKDIRDSTLFAEIKQAFEKSGGKADWDEMEGKAAKEIGGVKPTDIDAVTVFVTEVPKNSMPKNSMPKVVLILQANKPFNKTGVFHLDPQAKPDASGFYTIPGGDRALVHFPDDKTLVVLHPDLKQKYLDGYAKNRTGWPLNADLSKAAAGHTLFAVAHVDKVPNEMTTGPVAQFGGPLLSAKTVTLTADLKGKELSLTARAAFPDAASAGKARETVQGFIGMGAGFLANFSQSKDVAEFNSAIPAIKEAQRALKDAKVEVSGNDLVVSGSYKADFDIGAMVVQAVGKWKGSSERLIETNNFKQMVLALINYADTNQGVAVIHAVGPEWSATQDRERQTSPELARGHPALHRAARSLQAVQVERTVGLAQQQEAHREDAQDLRLAEAGQAGLHARANGHRPQRPVAGRDEVSRFDSRTARRTPSP